MAISLTPDDLRNLLAAAMQQAMISVPPTSAQTAPVPSFQNYEIGLEKWGAYMQRLNQHMIAHAVGDPHKKKAYFLSWVGANTYELINKLFSASELDAASFDDVTGKLDEHFKQSVHELAASYTFYQCKMKPGQTYGDWVADLRCIGRDCNFGASDVLDRLIRDMRETKLEIHRQIFVQHRSEVNTMISRAKQQYYEHKLAATDQKTCFKVVSELLDTAGTTLPDSTNNQHLCDDFAKFFSDKITLIRENIQRRVQDVDSRVCEETDRSAVQYTLDELAPTTEAELIRILRNSSDKTCCLDAIPTNLIKKYASLHIPYLVAIVNNSFKEGLFPSALRTAVVRPLLKKDNLDRNTMNNYRPISNIPFISKLMEKVAVSRVVEHLSNNNLMEEYQSAYRADHSTETALLKVHHDISSALDESHAVALVILDLSAAFDTIDQCQLLSLLNAEFGVHAKALSWLETYLEARTQRVKIDDAMSETIPLTCGVPQGSVLGPVLFTIYTMPMQRIIRKHGVVYHKYADDTQLYVTYKPNVLGDMQRAVKQLEDCISEIRVWMINRMLKLNDNKTDMVIYMSQYHLNKYGRCDISIGDSTISPVECVRNLGVQIDQHLTMDKQVTAVCKACNFHLYRLSSIRRYITTDAARSVVQALITSRLDYCNSLLANLTNTQMKRLKSIQHKAARLVTPVECRITYKLMVLVYKCVNGTAPAYLCRLIQPKCRDSRLRQPSDLELHRPVPKKAIGTAAFGFVGPDRWNKLPERLRESASLNIFKRDLKTHLFSNPL